MMKATSLEVCAALTLELQQQNTYMSHVIGACCVLHNICESKGEMLSDGWEVERVSG